MGDRPAAERACKDPNPIIDGRKANVNLAILGAKPRGNIQPGKYYIFAIFIIFLIWRFLKIYLAASSKEKNVFSGVYYQYL
ncbi:hypothetical protein O3M35_009283 [Rhynocoris fuscipes]|uniref:Uncharacterized protein n=1 Tax=Rhynocoris fuscipes TaxID=488301 RepID=A0AAW1D7R0_9HEMI